MMCYVSHACLLLLTQIQWRLPHKEAAVFQALQVQKLPLVGTQAKMLTALHVRPCLSLMFKSPARRKLQGTA